VVTLEEKNKNNSLRDSGACLCWLANRLVSGFEHVFTFEGGGGIGIEHV
jgi:hypothetical protein